MPAARPQLRMTARYCHSKPGTCLDRESRTALCHTVLSLLGRRYTGQAFHAPCCMSASTAGSHYCCVVLVAMPRAPERLAAWPLGRERPLFRPTVNTHLALDIHPDIPPMRPPHLQRAPSTYKILLPTLRSSAFMKNLSRCAAHSHNRSLSQGSQKMDLAWGAAVLKRRAT